MDAMVKDLLLDMHKDLAIIKADQAAMKADIREHIRRTNMLEAEMKWIQKQMWAVYGGGALFVFLVTIALKVFKG